MVLQLVIYQFNFRRLYEVQTTTEKIGNFSRYPPDLCTKSMTIYVINTHIHVSRIDVILRHDRRLCD